MRKQLIAAGTAIALGIATTMTGTIAFARGGGGGGGFGGGGHVGGFGGGGRAAGFGGFAHRSVFWADSENTPVEKARVYRAIRAQNDVLRTLARQRN